MRLQARRYASLAGCDLEVTVPGLLEAGGFRSVFGDGGPISLEIGLGKDPHLIERAARDPAGHYVGLEYSRKKLDMVLAKALARGVKNLRVLRADATRVLGPLFPEASLRAVYVFFPDPWPKKRHRKKRLVRPEFVATLAGRMRPGADLELRTDDLDYRDQMLAVLGASPEFANRLGAGVCATEPTPSSGEHIPTIFETKFRRAGRTVYYLYFERRRGAAP